MRAHAPNGPNWSGRGIIVAMIGAWLIACGASAYPAVPGTPAPLPTVAVPGAMPRTVSGVVTDTLGLPIADACIWVEVEAGVRDTDARDGGA